MLPLGKDDLREYYSGFDVCARRRRGTRKELIEGEGVRFHAHARRTSRRCTTRLTTTIEETLPSHLATAFG